MNRFKDTTIDRFQYSVEDLLVRNKSILDQMSKLSDSDSRINRSIAKAVTHCGCIKINASKQEYSEDTDFSNIKESLSSHLEGELCPECRDSLEKDMGRLLFYLTTICNNLDLNLYDIILKEYERLKLFGKFNLR